ncbi:hypothetical protein MKW98_002818 [Papaver atlanticum]|uniref:Uncharacterized protein n=1 Tax=Papaver atlanticum TaxID=357466 RepID=A0AAD4S964_9MAGN|nr:hypothetical protein MKW98_002818 [Papaver atlanticum]
MCFEGISNEHHKTFVQDFINKIDPNTSSISQEYGDHHLLVLMEALVCTLDNMSLEVVINHGRDIRHQLRDSWEKFLLLDSKEERQLYEAYLLVQTITLCTIHSLLHLEEDRILLSNPKYECLVSLANSVCYRLLRRCSQQSLTHEKGTNGTIVYEEDEDELDAIESGMQELTIDLHIAKVLFEKVI